MTEFFNIQGNSVYSEQHDANYFSFSTLSLNSTDALIEAIEKIDYKDCIKIMGWDRYIQKPFNFEDIIKKFENKKDDFYRYSEDLEDYLYENYSVKKEIIQLLSNKFLNKYDDLFNYTGQDMIAIRNLTDRAIKMELNDFIESVNKFEGYDDKIHNLLNDFYSEVNNFIYE